MKVWSYQFLISLASKSADTEDEDTRQGKNKKLEEQNQVNNYKSKVYEVLLIIKRPL